MEIGAIINKLRIKPGQKIAIINPPPDYEKLFWEGLGSKTSGDTKLSSYDFIHLFVENSDDFRNQAPKAAGSLGKDGIFWISYPKLSSDRHTDLDRGKCADFMKKLGYSPVSQISIDEVWSAMRFKPSGKVGAHTQVSRYVDLKKRTVTLPDDLAAAFNKRKNLVAKFNDLSFTHKKEYILWLESAKKEVTRAQRIKKIVQNVLNK